MPQLVQLTEASEVDAFITEHPKAVIFKAGTCHKTMQGWGNLERYLRSRDDVAIGVIRVVEHRPASNRVAETTGIVHQSPQVILFIEGKPRFDLDNWDITPERLEPLLNTHLPEAGVKSSAGLQSNLAPYRQLLRDHLEGRLDEETFSYRYLNMFRDDANLRSAEEFELLNSLFGNPDEHHIHPHTIMQLEPSQTTPLRERVASLLAQLEVLEGRPAGV